MRNHLAVLSAGVLAIGASGTSGAEALNGGFSVYSDVAFTSNYVFRGVTENDEEPAVQGTIEFGHDSGFYAGVWGSSGAAESGFGIELGPYVGYGFAITPELDGDVGVYHYHFSEDTDDDFTEVYAGLARDFGVVEGDLYVHFSNDYLGDAVSTSSENSVYVETHWTAPLGAGFYAMARAGYLDVDFDEADLDGYEWGVGAGYGYETLDLNVLVVDQEEASDTQVAVTLSRAF